MDQIVGLREEVIRFAIDMEIELKENDHKEHWGNFPIKKMVTRLKQETGELERAIRKAKRTGSLDDWATVRSEAADVGNFAMMVSYLAQCVSHEIIEALDSEDD